VRPDEVRRRHAEHRAERRARDAERSPGERVLQAYRLFCLWRPTPGEGVEVDPVRELSDVTEDLKERFETAGVPWVVGGSFALAAHGNPRFTYNLDVMVLVGIEQATQALDAERYERVDPVTLREATTDLYIDLHPVEDAAQRWAADRAATMDVLGDEVPVLSAEGLALMLLREATVGEDEARPLRLRDLELLARQPGLDWEPVQRWARQAGYEQAYEAIDAGDKPEL
jgi:hypothetical protein